MKKLTLVTLISGALSTSAFAGDDMEKIDSSFSSLDNDGNGYISQEEADDNDIWEHFANIDTDADKMISQDEFNQYASTHPMLFESDVLSASTTMGQGDNYDSADHVESDDSKYHEDPTPTDDEKIVADTDVEVDTEEGTMTTSTDTYKSADTMDSETTTTTQTTTTAKTGEEALPEDYNADGTQMTEMDRETEGSDEMVAKNEFDLMDVDKDGAVTKKEAEQIGVSETFEEIDGNGDQLITRVEYAEYRRNLDNDYDEE